MIEQNTKERIIEFAKQFYSKLDFAHNVEHGERVVLLALRINKFENGNCDLVEIGGWLHQLHDDIEYLDSFLDTLGLELKVKKQLIEIVENCRPKLINQSHSIETKIVFDADAIEVLGTYGFIREIFCNIKHRNKDWDSSINDAIEVNELFQDKLMTSTGKNLIKESNRVLSSFLNDYHFWRRKENEV